MIIKGLSQDGVVISVIVQQVPKLQNSSLSYKLDFHHQDGILHTESVQRIIFPLVCKFNNRKLKIEQVTVQKR